MSDWLNAGTETKTDELNSYLSTLKGQLDDIAEEYDNRIETRAKQIEDEDERRDFYEWSSDESWDYKESFPRILFSSFRVAAYTLLEAEIYSIARRIGEKQNQVFIHNIRMKGQTC